MSEDEFKLGSGHMNIETIEFRWDPPSWNDTEKIRMAPAQG